MNWELTELFDKILTAQLKAQKKDLEWKNNRPPKFLLYANPITLAMFKRNPIHKWKRDKTKDVNSLFEE